jgi:hypothetical protein
LILILFIAIFVLSPFVKPIFFFNFIIRHEIS